MLKKVLLIARELENVHHLKLTNGDYPTCRETRALLKDLKDEAHEVRKKVMEGYYKRKELTPAQLKAVKEAEKKYIHEVPVTEEVEEEEDKVEQEDIDEIGVVGETEDEEKSE